MTDTFDAVIIGGGIAGVSTAFHLCERGCRVAVLEKKFVAAEATSNPLFQAVRQAEGPVRNLAASAHPGR